MNKADGFTLLELLIGLTLLGFIMALLFGGFRLATQSWDSVETHALHTADEQAAFAFVRRVLGNVQPLRLNRLPGQPLAFAGQSDQLTLVAPLTEQTGLRTIVLAIERQDAGPAPYRLVLRDGPPPYEVVQLRDPVANAPGRLLIGNLQTARFEFFGRGQPGEPARWHDTWQHPEHFPDLIRLQMERPGSAPGEVIAATVIEADRSARVRITVGGVR